MKKLLIFAMLLLMGHGAFAQGGLTIDNSNGKCGVWVKMLGYDPLFPPDAFTCKLNSFTFLVPPGVIWTWCSVWEFQGSSPSCATPAIGWAFGVPIPAGSTTFQWTDVTFQWDRCNDCNAGGNMSNNALCGFSCWSGPQIFTSPACPANTAMWLPACLMPFANLTIVFTS